MDPRTPSEDPNDDRCRVCGQRGDLSFEHLPPRAAGNDAPAWLYGMEDWLARQDRGEKRRATIQQRGAGAHTLCRGCNSRAGRLYVPELVDWTRWALGGLAHMDPPIQELDRSMELRYAALALEDVRPARFLKQVVTMLLALGGGSFSAQHPDLRAYAADPERVGLPSRYQFYLAFYCGPNARYNGGSVQLRKDDQGRWDSVFTVELAHPPFSYVMSIDEPSLALETGNISAFAHLGIDQTANVSVQMIVGFGHTIFPMDYRSRAKFEADVAESEAFAAAHNIPVGPVDLSR